MMSPAWKAVLEIVDDLCGRRGLRQEWEAIDDGTQDEIKRTWAEIIEHEVPETIPQKKAKS